MEYSFGRSDNCLEAKDFSPQYYNAILAMGQTTALVKQMYWLFQLMRSLPSSIAGRLSTNFHTVLQMQKVRRPRLSSFYFLRAKKILKAISTLGYGESDCSTPRST